MADSDFPALPGFYKTFFLHFEPFSLVSGMFMIWFYPGDAWFHYQGVPSKDPVPNESLSPRTQMAMWQLANCYLLLALLAGIVFRTLRNALRHDPATQERLLGASFLALAIADATHILATFLCLPAELKYKPLLWNNVTHGNITVVMLLLTGRISWFLGIGRKRYYFGQPQVKLVEKETVSSEQKS